MLAGASYSKRTLYGENRPTAVVRRHWQRRRRGVEPRNRAPRPGSGGQAAPL